ncbi:MAG: OmpH family outer membrane protein [Planctomycetota bacterium]
MTKLPNALSAIARPRLQVAVAAAALALAGAVGCGDGSATPAGATAASGVAVIDLDAVAVALGSDKQIASAVEQRKEALTQKLNDLANGYRGQLEQHRAAASEENESGVQLAQYQQKANQSLGAAQRKAEQDLTAHRLRLFTQFRGAVRPVAQEVAAERGLSVVVTRQDALILACDESADITQEVIKRLKQQAEKPASDAGDAAAKPAP